MKYFYFSYLSFLLLSITVSAQTHTTHLLSYTTLSLEIADLDDDGDQDFLTGGISNLQWQENIGNNLFHSHTLTQDFNECHAIRVIDIDADGDKDIIVSSFTTDRIIWFENDGNQNFTQTVLTTAADGNAGIEVNDFDNDGDIDIVATSYNDDEVFWLQNDGNQNFTKIIIKTNFDGAGALRVFDVDSDGDKDVVVAGILADSVILLKNNGNLTFTSQYLQEVDGPRGIRIVDFDNDGTLDITYSGEGGYGWIKNINAVFTINHLGNSDCRDFLAVDVNNDNHKDLILAYYDDDEIGWAQNNGNMTFTGMGYIESNLSYVAYLGAADFNGDNYVEIVGASGPEVKYYINNSGTSFTKKQLNKSLYLVKSACSGDFDNDGDIDLMAIGYLNNMFYRNDGNDIFTPISVFSTNNTFGGEECRAADMDSDGDMDVLYTEGTGNSINWLENQGGGTFVYRTVYGLVDAKCVFAVDYDFDGDMDVVASTVETYTLSAIYWYENDGNEDFTEHLVNGNYAYPNGIFAFDWDQDNFMDVAAAYSGTGGSQKVILHDGQNGFSTTVNNNAQGANSVFAIDMDNDGDMDILSAGFNDDDIIWYENPGHTPHIIDANALNATHVFAGDMDGDGDIDVASTSSFDNKVSWYQNNGNQSFSKKPLANNVPYPEWIDGGDVDGDGIMDLYSVCKESQSVALYIKAPAPPPLSLSTCSDLFISEYIEGSSNNKAIEIYNPTSADIDLTGHEISVYQNGATSPTQTVALTGFISANGVYVVAHQSAIAPITNFADQTFGFGFNGNDAVGLLKNGQLIDIVGKIGEDPGTEWSNGGASTLDKTLVRKVNISKGSNLNIPFVANSEWDVYPIDNTTFLFGHSSQCANYCPASVNINASATSFCVGASVTFTTTAVNQGATPVYQWKKNGVNVATGATYTTTTLANNDTIKCIMTSSQVCAIDPSTSNAIVVTVSPSVTPTISIAASATTICSGNSITFTANGANSGSTPTYVWKKNGTTVGTNSSTYSSSTLANNDVITCVFTSNAGCVSANNITSNSITITVNTSSTPSVSIGTANTTICAGTAITITATAINGGTSPTYQWYKNNNLISGATNISYSTSTAANNDVFKCILTSNSACATAPTATSNNITMTVNPQPVTSTITANGPTTICTGNVVTLSGNNNGGTWSNGATSNAISVSTAGSYFVTNANSCGSVNSNTINVIVNAAPTASTITAGGTTTFCAGNTLTLSGNVGGTWSNGATTPSITVNSSGNYFVTNSNNCGTINSNTIAVTVNSIPIAPTITANGPTTICTGNVVTLSGNNNGGTWSNGATTNAITVSTAGNYYVTNANSCGSVNSNTINVIVNAAPTASTITASGATSFCVGNTVTLSGNNNGGTWSNGATTTTINVNASGNYFVTNSNNCGTINSNTISVTVNPLPTAATIAATGPTTICTGDFVTLYGNNNGGTWSNGATSNAISLSTAGNYFVTNSNSCGSVNSNTINVIVNAAPTASTITAGGSTTFCTGNTVTLSGNNNGGTWSNGATTSTINVNASGNYFVTNSNNCGTINSNTIAVTVNPLPTAATITANGPTTICTGATVTLSGNNNGGNWSNGATTSSINVATAGNYFVTNTNGCGSVNSNTINVIVNAAPTASTITAGGSITFCEGNTVTLSGNSNGGTWSNGATTATISVNASGNYFVTNSNNCGTINSNTIVVTVNPLPTAAAITANGPTTICTGATVTLSGNNNGGTWSNGATTASINVATAGNYFVTNTNGCGSVNSNTIDVIVSSGPIASTITAVGSTTFCAGNSVTLNGNNGGTWSNGATSASINVNTSGDYYVTNTDACGSVTSNSILVTVNPQPVAANISAIGATSICNGNSVQLTGNVDGTWSNGATTPSITVIAAGNYFVTNTNSCGSVNSNTINVIVDSLPLAATISAVGSTAVCDGSTVILTGNIDGTWSNGETSPAIAVTTSGTYFVSNTNGCGNSVSNQITVTVFPQATTPIITQVGYNLETVTGYNSYQWFNNNFPIPNETNISFTPTASGDYYVLVVDSNGCQAQSAVYNFVYVGFNENMASTSLIVVPNPAGDFICLKSKNNTKLEGNLKIWNINGAIICEKQVLLYPRYYINIEDWANGMYMIEFTNNENTIREKFIKQ